MQLKNLFRSILFFLLLVTFSADAFEYVLTYPKGKFVQGTFRPSYENIDIGLEQLHQDALNHLPSSLARELREYHGGGIHGGTCYGQSYTFMLRNPPTAKKMQPITKDEAQLQILWFQAQNSIGVFFKEKMEALMKEGLDIIRKSKPGQPVDETMNFLQISEELIRCNLNSVPPHELRAYMEHFNDLTPMLKFYEKREQDEKGILSKKGFKDLPKQIFNGASYKKGEFQKKVQGALEKLANDPAVSDVIIGFGLDFDGKSSGHAILLQFKHLRVYDANSGIHKYKTKKDLLKDIVVTRQEGCDYVTLRPYSHKSKDAKPSVKNKNPKKDQKKSKDQKKGKKGKR